MKSKANRRPRTEDGLVFVRVGKSNQAGGAAFDHRISNGGEIVIREHDYIVLTQDIPDAQLQAGDLGTVVHIHAGSAAYEVEFMTLTGETIAVATVLASQLRPVRRNDISHVRVLAVG